jgi:hypothetical protein
MPAASRSGKIPARIAKRLRKIRRLCRMLAREFGIFEPFVVGAVSPRSTDFEYYGMAYAATRDTPYTIIIRTFSRFDGSDLPSDVLVDTVCHEMAHIPHMSHRKAWRILYHAMLRWASITGQEV